MSHMVLAPFGSSIALPTQSVLIKYGIPQFSITATNNNLTDGESFDKDKSTFSRVIPNNKAFVEAMLSLCQSKKWNKIYLVSGSDPFDIDLAQTINSLKGEFDIKVVEHLMFVTNKKDIPTSKLDEISMKIESQETRIVYLACIQHELEQLIKHFDK